MKLSNHLIEVNHINNQVDLKGWSVMNKYITEDECYYNLKKIDEDTTLSFSFTFFKNMDVYKVDDFIKSFKREGAYTEMALSNNDTLYFFISSDNSMMIESSKPVDLKLLNFKTGKYYFLYRRGLLNWKQIVFFENNSDSLIKVRGNDLPELPDDSISIK